jgi:hypothetical protein
MVSLHIIASYPVPTNPKYEIDAHTIKIIKYCELLYSMGYTIHFYGANGCQQYLKYTYYHSVIELSDYSEAISITNDFTDPEYLMIGSQRLDEIKGKIDKIFSTNLKISLSKNYSTGDFILHFFQHYIYPDKINVRMAHGGGDWKMYKYISFETEAYMNHEIDTESNLKTNQVIHPWFDPNDYVYDPMNKYTIPTYLYMARCHMYKGIHFFINLSTYYLKYNFIIAGGSISYDPETQIMNVGHMEGSEDNYEIIF